MKTDEKIEKLNNIIQIFSRITEDCLFPLFERQASFTQIDTYIMIESSISALYVEAEKLDDEHLFDCMKLRTISALEEIVRIAERNIKKLEKQGF